MPEIGLKPLQIPTGASSSETETSTTDRSSASGPTNARRSSLPVPARVAMKKSPVLKKMRKSGLVLRPQKKQALKPSVQLKNVVCQLNTRLSRSLMLSPSTSSASLVTNYPSSNVSNVSSKQPTPRLPLQREKTSLIVKYRARKSLSQMDMKDARRFGTYPLVKNPMQHVPDATGDSSSLVAMNASSKDSLMNKLLSPEGNYYLLMEDRDTRCAGARVFATIMLNAWRKRRDDVKRLNQEMEDLKKGTTKTKNQLHVFNTLFRIEQRRNDELTSHLKRSIEDINIVKDRCDSLTVALNNIKEDKDTLQQELIFKEQEYEALNELLKQTNSELFQAMGQQRELQSNLSAEQRKAQFLENQKNELIDEICEINADFRVKEDKLRTEMQAIDYELCKTKYAIKKHEELLAEIQVKDLAISDLAEKETQLKEEIKSLEDEAQKLNERLGATVEQRLKACWGQAQSYNKATFDVFHMVLFCMLPAVPPPKTTKLPIGNAMQKVLKMLKR